ncbi:hypothetical protein Poli38472_004904 [Pythium oligandrum]|uniref:Uncharacterized protein n=1 Tax=Pythium oligandrum TaxID=41045 RepID=A0A8K1FDV7_PYTOL|nr:hypothetical protein Poli38472_004904 [Pythium oligandrum]|eukprot:TMW59835.1 hypothetical protein Poli38472_004904 [Pythium oligandrum]
MTWTDLELDDDPATLRAALEMLDALDESYGASPLSDKTTGSSEATEDSDEQEKMAQEAKTGDNTQVTVRKHRNRRKDELVYLRSKVKQMEETLLTLKRRRIEDKHEGSIAVSRVWEDLAIRQQRQRQMVEFENAKLRVMLGAQLKAGKELIRLLQSTSRCDDEQVTQMVRTSDLNVHHAISIDEQFARVDELYRVSYAAFGAFPMDSHKGTTREIKISEDDPNMISINLCAAWTLPFPKVQVLAATWQSVIQTGPKKNCGYPLARNDDTERMSAVFRSDASIVDKSISGEVEGSLVAKKFPGSALMHDVIITSFNAELIKSLPRSMDDLRFNQDSWIRVMDISHQSELATQPLTQIQISRRVNLHVVTNRSATQRRRAGLLTEFTLAQMENDVIQRQETIENLLFAAKLTATRLR